MIFKLNVCFWLGNYIFIYSEEVKFCRGGDFKDYGKTWQLASREELKNLGGADP